LPHQGKRERERDIPARPLHHHLKRREGHFFLMGWWPFGRGGDLAASKLTDGGGGKKQASAAAAAGVTTSAADPALALVATRPTSVFAFGPVVAPGGDVLRGMCAGDDPDAIQACTWTIEKAQQGAGKAHAYVVEF
jgi:hypothetical protein